MEVCRGEWNGAFLTNPSFVYSNSTNGACKNQRSILVPHPEHMYMWSNYVPEYASCSNARYAYGLYGLVVFDLPSIEWRYLWDQYRAITDNNITTCYMGILVEVLETRSVVVSCNRYPRKLERGASRRSVIYSSSNSYCLTTNKAICRLNIFMNCNLFILIYVPE